MYLNLKTLLFSSLCCASAIHAQVPGIRNAVPVINSLSEELRCLYFDKQGMMWIGTNVGLKRYDGYQVRDFRQSVNKPDLLPHNTVLCLTEDSLDGLWAGTRHGLTRLDRKTGRTETFQLPYPQQQVIYCLFTSRDGKVWIGTDGGLVCYTPESDTFRQCNGPEAQCVQPDGRRYPMGNFSVKSIVEDDNGCFYIGTWNSGLFRYNPKTNVYEGYPRVNESNSTFTLLLDSRKRLWIGSWGKGLFIMDRPQNPKDPGLSCVVSPEEGFHAYLQLLENKVDNTVWAGHSAGLTVFSMDNPLTGRREYKQAGEMPLGYCAGVRTYGYGSVWVESMYDGIVRYNSQKPPITFYPLSTSGSDVQPRNVASIATADGKTVWASLQPHGVAMIDVASGTTLFNRQIPGFDALPDKVLFGGTSSIVCRRNGEVWMGTMGDGVVVYHPEKKKAERMTGKNVPWIEDDYVNCLFEDDGGNLWIGQRTRLSVVMPDGKGVRLKLSNGQDDFSRCDVRSVTQDSEGCYWVATDNMGVISICGNPRNPGGLKCRRYSRDNGGYPVLSATACFADSGKRLWAISTSGGLFAYDGRKDRFEAKNDVYQIIGESVYAINEDSQGRIYLSTSGALMRIEWDSTGHATIRKFSEHDGLKNRFFLPNATCRFGDSVYFGGKKGVFALSCCDKDMPKQKYPLVLSDILIDDIGYEDLDSSFRMRISSVLPMFSRRIVLPASVRKVRFDFSLLSYSPNNEYAFWMEGYDKSWKHSGRFRSIGFQNLPAGHYRLRVKATAGDGIWRELESPIEIVVLPPWYFTWWAYLVYAVLAVGIIWMLMRRYRNNLRMRGRLQMGILLSNITHELLTPLSVISAAVEELKSEAPAYDGQYRLMQNNIDRITRLLRTILEVRKSQEGQLRLKVGEADIAGYVVQTCESVRPISSTRKNPFQITVPPVPVMAWFDSDKLDKIIYNLLSNAFKYNKVGGKVQVTLAVDGDHARLQVSDEGIGISKENMKHLYSRFLDGDYRRMKTEGTGIGLSLTKELVELHHGTISCESEAGVGTTFTVTIPISRQAYSVTEREAEGQGLDARDHVELLTDGMGGGIQLADLGKEFAMLIVEDDTELLQMMKRILAKRYKVLTAKNGSQAWNIIQREELDIVISDLMMPVMDGVELTRRIKESEDFGQLPVIMLTAKTDCEDRVEGYSVGADDYLTKPFRMDELQVRVDSIIMNRERIRKRFSRQMDFKVEEQHYSSPDELFIQRAIQCVKNHIADSEYDRETFAHDMCVSSSTLYNKLRAITGQNISGFVNSVRLKEACLMARMNPDIQVSELAYRVGYNSSRYFALCFKKEFGMLPKEFMEKEKARKT